MKKLFLIIIFGLGTMLYLKANEYPMNNSSHAISVGIVQGDQMFISSIFSLNKSELNVTLSDYEYVDCWELANEAEEALCGSVGCDYDFWDAFYSACQCFSNNDSRYC